jgi:hypothetical protein
MARFRCTACARTGECEYEPDGHACPLCGSRDVVFALAIEELPDEVLEALASIAPSGDDEAEE